MSLPESERKDAELLPALLLARADKEGEDGRRGLPALGLGRWTCGLYVGCARASDVGKADAGLV